jgi:hypothetical protein
LLLRRLACRSIRRSEYRFRLPLWRVSAADGLGVRRRCLFQAGTCLRRGTVQNLWPRRPDHIGIAVSAFKEFQPPIRGGPGPRSTEKTAGNARTSDWRPLAGDAAASALRLLPDLPVQHEPVDEEPMPPAQATCYAKAISAARAGGHGDLLTALQRLRAVSLHPDPDAEVDDSGVVHLTLDSRKHAVRVGFAPR